MRLEKAILPLIILLIAFFFFTENMLAPTKSVGILIKNSQEDVLSALEDCLPVDRSTPRTILSKGIPLLEEQLEARKEQREKKRDFCSALLYDIFQIDWHDMQTFLSSQIPLLIAENNMLTINKTIALTGQTDNLPATNKNASRPQPFQEKDEISKKIPGKPLIAIYHTHTAESYLPWAGVTHAQGGKKGNIVDVGNILSKCLEKQGIKVVHSVSIHDYPTFRESYRRSYITASKLLQEYPSLKMIIDLHRDAGVQEKATINIQGQEVARILIDIGTDRLGLPHPNWRKNLALGQLIEKRMNEKYPGLCRGIVISEARYNQHVSPHAVLLEIGDEKCTKEQTFRSAALCAEVVGQIVKKCPE